MDDTATTVERCKYCGDEVRALFNSFYNEYEDPDCPPCNCADWGMTGCLSSCRREVYVRSQRYIRYCNNCKSYV